MVYVLFRLVRGQWLPVLTSPQDCPTPVVVTVCGPKNHNQLREWVKQYCEKNEQEVHLFQLRGLEIRTAVSHVGAGF